MKKISILILVGLLLPAFVFGAVGYSRSPIGYTIENPVNFSVSFDNFEEVCNFPIINYWGFNVQGADWADPDWPDYTFRNFPELGCIASTTKSYVANVSLPLGEYGAIAIACFQNEAQCNLYEFQGGSYLEYNDDDPIFEVVEEGPTGFLIITPTFITGTLAYIQGLFSGSGLWPLIALIIGLPLAFWVVGRIIGLVKKSKETDKIIDEIYKRTQKRWEKEDRKEQNEIDKAYKRTEKRWEREDKMKKKAWL